MKATVGRDSHRTARLLENASPVIEDEGDEAASERAPGGGSTFTKPGWIGDRM
jgi:hypothetical protein